jgi:hypothetical protein
VKTVLAGKMMSTSPREKWNVFLLVRHEYPAQQRRAEQEKSHTGTK